MKKVALLVIMVSILLTGNTMSSKAASKQADDAYQTFVSQLKADKKQYPDGVYYATMKSGKGAEILLVSDAVYEDKGKKAISAKIYQYVDGKVTYMGEISSDGTAYPLAKRGKYVVFGGNHTSEKVMVSDGKAIGYKLDGIYLNQKTATKEKYTMVNNKKKVVYSKKLCSKKAEKQYYYVNSVKEIKFKQA